MIVKNLNKSLTKREKMLLDQMKIHNFEITKTQFELKELFGQIGKIRQSVRSKILANLDTNETVKDLKPKIEHVKKLYRQDLDFE